MRETKTKEEPGLNKQILARDSRTWVYLDGVRFEDCHFAAAYREAGDRLVKQISRSRQNLSPDLFMPILYLYRHSLELELKMLIRFGSGVFDDDKKLRSVLKKHDLYELWNYVKRICDEVSPGSTSSPVCMQVESVLLKVHQIDGLGQSLRYSTDKHGNKSQKNFPKFVELKRLQRIVGQVFSSLAGIHDGLIETLSYK
jgi:hypothetical protein